MVITDEISDDTELFQAKVQNRCEGRHAVKQENNNRRKKKTRSEN